MISPRAFLKAAQASPFLLVVLSLLAPSASHVLPHPVAVTQANPVASFTWLPANAIVNQPVTFDGSSSSGTGIGYTWAFGDGTPQFTNITATHTYSRTGTFSVSLRVEDSQLINSTLQLPLLVSNGLPSASFTWSPLEPVQGTAVTFDATNSSDPNGRIVRYTWDWGDSGTNITTTPRVAHTYIAANHYTVALIVTDNLNLTGSSSLTVNVKSSNVLPVAIFTTTPQTTYVGDAVSFNGSSSYDPDGVYPVSLRWLYGDGTYQNGGNITTHIYPYSGLFNVTLIVTDDSGGNSSLVQKVFVLPRLTVTPVLSTTTGTPPLRISFIAQASGGQGPYSFQWSFGDGQSSTGQVIAHNYTNTGVYTAQLKAIDSAGHVALGNATITVSSLYFGLLPIPYVLGGIGVAAVALLALLVFYGYFLRNARRRESPQWSSVGSNRRHAGSFCIGIISHLTRMMSFRRNQNDEV